MSENNKVKKVREFWKQGWQDNLRWRPRAKENLRFYHGNQWNPEDKQLLESRRQPALTINRILPVINFLSGVQRQNRSDTRVFARKGGTVKVAQALTELHKHAMDVSNGEYEESMCFLAGMVLGKAWINFDVNYENDPLNGDIILEYTSPFDIIEDRHQEKYDLNRSATFLIRQSWAKKKDLILQYPKKKSDIESEGLVMPEGDPDLLHYEGDLDDADDDYNRDEDHELDPLIRKEREEYRVRECWYKEKEKRTFLINQNMLQVQPVSKEKVAFAQALVQKSPGWILIDRIVPVMKMVKTVGNVVLEEHYDPFDGLCLFPYFRFAPYWLEGNIMGVVDNLIDPQSEHNKRRSQILHILNTTANSGWIVKKISLMYKKILENFGSMTGTIIEKDKCGGEVEKIRANDIPQGHMAMAEMAPNDIKDISSVDANLLGHLPEKGDESGRSRYLRQQQGMIASEIMFDNFRYSRQLTSQFLIEFIRRTNYYSPMEIRAILDESSMDVSLDQLQSFAIGRYGIKVEQTQNHPTTRIMNYELLLDAVKTGLPINPRFLIEASDLPNKEAIIQDLDMRMQMQMQAEQQALTAGVA